MEINGQKGSVTYWRNERTQLSGNNDGIIAQYRYEGTGLGVPTKARGNMHKSHRTGRSILNLVECEICGPGYIYKKGWGIRSHMNHKHSLTLHFH